MTGQPPDSSPPRLHVKVGMRDGARRDLYFDRSFLIGRQQDCDVCIPDEYVSRTHAEVILYQGQWWVQDQSSGGIFINDERIQCVQVSGTLVIRLGAGGPLVGLQAETGVQPAVEHRSATQPAP